MKKNNIILPIFDKFDQDWPIGQITINPDILPKHPKWRINLGYRTLELDSEGKVIAYEPVCFSIIEDDKYKEFLIQEGEVT